MRQRLGGGILYASRSPWAARHRWWRRDGVALGAPLCVDQSSSSSSKRQHLPSSCVCVSFASVRARFSIIDMKDGCYCVQLSVVVGLGPTPTSHRFSKHYLLPLMVGGGQFDDLLQLSTKWIMIDAGRRHHWRYGLGKLLIKLLTRLLSMQIWLNFSF